jgi:putative ABC transport system substrate-binding protein
MLFIGIIIFAVPVFAAPKTIGVIMVPYMEYFESTHKAFMKTLSSEGYGQDKVTIIMQKPLPEPMSFRNTVRKFAAIETDVIVAYGAPAMIASMKEQSDIPVVFAGVYSSESFGILGKKITGVDSKVPVTTVLKHLMSLKKFSRLGVVYSKTEKDSIIQADNIKKLESTLGFSSVRYNVLKTKDTLNIANIDALFISTACPALYCLDNIIDIARNAKIPTATIIGGEALSGIILNLYANPDEQGREAAKLAIKILEGSNPAMLPVVKPKKIDLVINLKEASSLGIKVPFDLLSSATKIIK